MYVRLIFGQFLYFLAKVMIISLWKCIFIRWRIMELLVFINRVEFSAVLTSIEIMTKLFEIPNLTKL